MTTAAQQKQTHWRQVHRRKNEHLLFAEDLGPIGTRVDVEIADSGIFTIKGQDNSNDTMPWLAFRGKKKQLGLNRGNCKAMQSITGTPIVERWRGWITLIVVKTTYTDKVTKERYTTDAIRVAAERPKGRESAPRDPDPRDAAPPAPTQPAQNDPSTLSDDEARDIARAEAEEARRRG